MEILKFVIILSCYACYGYASDDGYTIPVENYETELHNLGEHVEIPETPIKIIKITKTVAVKIPVPYPVKVIEKVPYPVHISKPYPVPVPQIVKVPHVKSPPRLPEHEALGSGALYQPGKQNIYDTQDVHAQDQESYEPGAQSYSGGQSEPQSFVPYGEDYSSDGSSGSSYEPPSHNYHGSVVNDESTETKSYDEAIKNYLQKINSVHNAGHGTHNYHYH